MKLEINHFADISNAIALKMKRIMYKSCPGNKGELWCPLRHCCVHYHPGNTQWDLKPEWKETKVVHSQDMLPDTVETSIVCQNQEK